MIKVIDMFIKNLNGLKKNIKLSEEKKLQRIRKNPKKVRKQIKEQKQDVTKLDRGRTSIQIRIISVINNRAVPPIPTMVT
jgi:hypothetical protein